MGLAYYGYSYTAEAASRERAVLVDTLTELAEEKAVGIESQILDSDEKVFSGIQLEPLSDLQAVVKAHGAAVSSVFVLDENFRVIPGGYASKRPRDAGVAFGDYFMSEIVPSLPLQEQAPHTRGHVHGSWGGRPYLFSFTKRPWGDHTYYVVLEEDLSHLVGSVFPQFFTTRSPRVYQIVDEQGDLIYGAPLFAGGASDNVLVELPFVDTVDGWSLRVTQKDSGVDAVRKRRRMIDYFLIAMAFVVVVAGLGFLVAAIRRERRANELKSEFISNVSHELKTPLSIISMLGELLAQGRTKSAAQTTEYADIIWRESVRLASLIDNVLDFAKIERGVDAYEFAEADIAEVLERAVELSAHRLTKAGMALTCVIAPDLPPVKLDANAYTLAVLNLVDNAIKYAADSKRVELRLEAEADNVVLSVRDFGHGIAEDEQEKIFERFYRARAVRLLPIRGSGIGLALVRHIAHAHRGEIEVHSTPGQGTVFRLLIPQAAPGSLVQPRQP